MLLSAKLEFSWLMDLIQSLYNWLEYDVQLEWFTKFIIVSAGQYCTDMPRQRNFSFHVWFNGLEVSEIWDDYYFQEFAFLKIQI